MARPDFSERASTIELMDSEATSFEDYLSCLRDLERVNRMTFSYRPTLAFLDCLAASGRLRRGRPIRIVDAGSGYGDMLRRIAAWGERRAIDLELTGIDLNPAAARAAQSATPEDVAIRWVSGDMFTHDEPHGIDLVVSSLLAHHLDGKGPVRLLDWMEGRARIAWFVNDLHRHPLPYAVFRGWSRLAGWHRFVQHDGPVSITRAFTAADWRHYLALSSVPAGAAKISWWMPFRLCVARLKEP